ncbi:MAG TPA: P27 family phage terminase small subunit [Thermomicrobiales bacterium]|nr:P27 family phage terminase small subunit [Thermomicrobiales bacterium]
MHATSGDIVAGKRQKAPSRLVGHRQAAPLTVVTPGLAPAPPAPPKGLTKTARLAWESFFASPIAAAVDIRTDGPALLRWAKALGRHERVARDFAKQPTVAGSTGQTVLNPLHGELVRLTREIERAEEHFGMTPLARMRLGVAIGEARATLADLQASLAGPAAGAPDDAAVIDLDELA